MSTEDEFYVHTDEEIDTTSESDERKEGEADPETTVDPTATVDPGADDDPDPFTPSETPDPTPLVEETESQEEEDPPPVPTYHTVTKTVTEIISDYSQDAINQYIALNAVAYAVYDDETIVQVAWEDVHDPTPAAIVSEAAAIARANNQHFWSRAQAPDPDDGAGTGAFVTDDTQEAFLAAAAQDFPDIGEGEGKKPWNNILITSIGLLLRSGKTWLAQFSRSAVAFYDGLGDRAENIVASFGLGGAVIGQSGGHKVAVAPGKISMYDKDDIELFNVSSFSSASEGGITQVFPSTYTSQTVTGAPQPIYPMGKRSIDIKAEANNVISGLIPSVSISLGRVIVDDAVYNATFGNVVEEQDCTISLSTSECTISPTPSSFNVSTPIKSGGYTYNWKAAVTVRYQSGQSTISAQQLTIRGYLRIIKLDDEYTRISNYYETIVYPMGKTEISVGVPEFYIAYSGEVPNPTMLFGTGNSIGSYGAAFGENNSIPHQSQGHYSYLFGKNNTVSSGDDNFAAGRFNQVFEGGVALGSGLKAGNGVVAVGAYNDSTLLNKAFIIGNGGDASNRSDALYVDDFGGIFHRGGLYVIRDTYSLPYITLVEGDRYGDALLVGAKGLTIVGAGEYPSSRWGVGDLTAGSERLYLGADGAVYIEANANTISNRKTWTFGTDGKLKLPEALEVSQGGTNATNKADARTNLGLARSRDTTAANVLTVASDFTVSNVTCLYTDVWAQLRTAIKTNNALTSGTNYSVATIKDAYKPYMGTAGGMYSGTNADVYVDGSAVIHVVPRININADATLYISIPMYFLA